MSLLSQTWIEDQSKEKTKNRKLLVELDSQLNGGIIMTEENTLDLMTKEGCTVLKVMLQIVDAFNGAKIEQKDTRPTLFVAESAKNTDTEIFSKYQRGLISVRELYAEAAASGRRLYFNTTMGETNANS